MNKLIALTAVVALQAGCVSVAVAPQLSARLTGDTYELRVAPLDPIDPFRGAYVTLDYPDLARDTQTDGGPLYITLTDNGGVMVADEFLRERPDGDQPYLTCNDRGWQIECGIESLFLPQDEAAGMQDTLRDGAVAEVKIDGRGNAALIGVRAP